MTKKCLERVECIEALLKCVTPYMTKNLMCRGIGYIGIKYITMLLAILIEMAASGYLLYSKTRNGDTNLPITQKSVNFQSNLVQLTQKLLYLASPAMSLRMHNTEKWLGLEQICILWSFCCKVSEPSPEFTDNILAYEANASLVSELLLQEERVTEHLPSLHV